MTVTHPSARLKLSLGFLLLPMLFAPGAAAQESAMNTSDGVYSEEQAERGEEVFDWVCSECHLPAEFKGIIEEWAGSSAFDAYEQIRTTMPEDSPGSLRNQEYADVLAYILDLNGVPAGTTELSAEAEALRDIRVAAPPEGLQ